MPWILVLIAAWYGFTHQDQLFNALPSPQSVVAALPSPGSLANMLPSGSAVSLPALPVSPAASATPSLPNLNSAARPAGCGDIDSSGNIHYCFH